MKHDTRTASDIERDIADERAQMSSTLNDLQKKFSVDTILDDLGHMTRDLGDDFGRTFRKTAGRNPAAVVIVGVGLAWLFLGQNRNATANSGGPGLERGFESRRGLDQQDHDQISTNPSANGALGNGGSWFADTHSQWDKASDQSGRGPKEMKNSASGAAHAAGDAISDASSRIGEAASDLSERLTLGLEDLSEAGKARVISARRAAQEARKTSEAAMHRGADTAASIFKDQPLVVAALAVAFGAAIGSLLPHSQLEDDTIGDSSDRLFHEAQAIYREERDKTMAALQGADGDAKDEIADIGSEIRADAEDLLPEDKSLGQAFVDRASDATKRVYDRAKDNFDTPKTDQSKA